MVTPGHRAHILGFSAQTNYGIGFATNMNWEWRHAFVFISAPPDNDAVVTPYVAWLFENNTLKQIHDMDFGDGWRYLPWLDTFNDNFFPWLYHYQHKWMYWVGEDVSNIWFYTLDMEWTWTSNSIYPYIYRGRDNTWLYFDRSSENPRWFYNVNEDNWESWD